MYFLAQYLSKYLMLQKIPTNNANSKPILMCIHDILDTCPSAWSKEIAKNLSDYMINRFLKHGYDVCIGTNEDELLTIGLDDYTHTVIIASGTSPKLSDRLIEAIEQKCLEDFYVAGHVLDRNESYFELHHQFYIINSKIHKELGCPSLGEASNFPHKKIEPFSKTDDGYISQELLPGNKEKDYSSTMHGWNLLTVALNNKKRIVDLGNDIRNNKKYFYYEYDHVFLRESTSLFYYQYMFNNIVVPFNSDILNDSLDYSGPVDQYITLGTGINWVENLHLIGFTENTTIFFTDINPLVLQFTKSMIEQWDGKDYVDFYLKQNFFIPNNLPYDYEDYVSQICQQWNAFLTTVKDWEAKWNRVRQLRFKFISIDYMSEYNFDWFGSDKKTIFNASDMFDHVPGIFQQSMKYRIAAENRFLTKLKNKNPNISLIWTRRSAEAFLSSDQYSRFQKVSEIDLIDIEKIIRPYWHKDDWDVLRPLV
jgi:hypothetical protein